MQGLRSLDGMLQQHADERWLALARIVTAEPIPLTEDLCMTKDAEDVTVDIRQVISDSLRLVLRRPFPVPPDFEEAACLAANPDVADAVAKGYLPSGVAHDMAYGRLEGRARPFRSLPQSGE